MFFLSAFTNNGAPEHHANLCSCATVLVIELFYVPNIIKTVPQILWSDILEARDSLLIYMYINTYKTEERVGGGGGLVCRVVQFSHSVMSESLPPHGLQHTRPPCRSPTPEFIQTHAHWVGDTIQPSYPLSPPPPPICDEVMGSDAMILVFWMLSFKPTFSLSSFTFTKRLFSSSFFLP